MKKMKYERCKKSKKQKDAAQNPKMGEDFFTFLPSEIIINILSRLPIRTTMSCKAVCKPWLDLLRTPEFAKSHISKSVTGLAVFLEGEYPKPYKVFEYVDELNNPKRRRVPRWNMILNFNLPSDKPPYSSADGLLFLCTRGMMSREIFQSGIFSQEYIRWPRDLFICNPITRGYIKLPCPPEFSSSEPKVHMDTFGFGVSRTTGQYKLVRVFHEWILNKRLALAELVEPKFQVYSVGTGSWSGIASADLFKYEGNAKGAFLNGNIHWLVRDLYGSSVWISCFDLETEIFRTFCPPPCRRDDREECLSVSTLRDCLCMCDNTAYNEIVIWLMREYGDDKSWTKELVIRKKDLDYNEGLMCPIKAFQNGDILMALEYSKLLTLYFSSKTKTLKTTLFGWQSCFCIRTVGYAPSFLPLKTLAMDNVTSF